MTDPGTSDESLLAEFIRGDRAALGELARRHERMLLGVAMGLLNGRSDLAADAVQETWVRVIRFATSFKGGSSFKTWVYRIAVNQCRSIRSLRETVLDSEALDAMPLARIQPTPGAGVVIEERQSELREAVERLGAEKREVVLLCYHSGMTHEQVADVLGVPMGTVKSRLHAALTELRRVLGKEKEAVG